MISRRDIINHALSSIEDSDAATVKFADCSDVSQINVFSGASININVTERNNAKTVYIVAQDDCARGQDRDKIYRVCHAIAKQHSIYEEMRHYIKENWRAFSMRELPYTALQELLLFMRRLQEEKRQTG